MNNLNTDGLIGMGFSSLDKNHLTVIDNLYEQNQIPIKVNHL